MLSFLHMFHHRAGDAREAHAYATRGQAVASRCEDPAAIALARAQLGISFTLAGHLDDARVEFEAALQQSGIFLQAFDYRAIARGYLARVLWLQGYPARAAESLRSNVAEAMRSGHPVSLAFALSFAVPLLLWLGDIDAAEEHAEWFSAHTQSHSLPLSLATGRGFRGQLAIARGEARAGLAMLEDSLRDLGAANYNVWATSFNISRGQGLFALGRFAEALSLIDDTIRETRENGDQTYIPELLRMKANVLRAMEPDGLDDADACVTDSLEWSRRQGARASELRAAIDLAELRLRQNRSADARAVLRPVFAAFDEGFDTADLERAKRLLTTVG
jgi:tetratricopeptide (TPR) repeat protein